MATERALAITDKLKKYAKQLFEKVCEYAQLYKRSWPDVGKISLEVREKELWKILGFADIAAWREKAQLSRSTFYDCVACYDGLKDGLSIEQMRKIPRQNAKHLIKLPKKQRFAKHWVEWAAIMTETEFESRVKEAIKKAGPDVSIPEKRGMLVFRVYETQKHRIMETIKDAALNENLGDDFGSALEFVCANFSTGVEKERKEAARDIGNIFFAYLKHNFELAKQQRNILTSDNPADAQLADLHETVQKFAENTYESMEKLDLCGKQLNISDWNTTTEGGEKPKTNGHAKKGKKAKQHAAEAIGTPVVAHIKGHKGDTIDIAEAAKIQ
jgi:hypothetical protein